MPDDMKPSPIDTMGEPSVLALPVADVADPSSPKCVACGHYHGSIGQEIHCLRAAVARLAKEIEALRLDFARRTPSSGVKFQE